MKRIIPLLLAVVCLAACTSESRYERKLKEVSVAHLKEQLKFPDSLKDVEITYATLSRKEVCDAMGWVYSIEDSDHTKTVVIVKGQAKNPLGVYGETLAAFTYYDSFIGKKGLNPCSPITTNEGGLVEALLRSPNKKVIK